MSFNKITLVGNLGRDPELRYTPSGVAVCGFSMATTEKRKDNTGEFQKVTTWFQVQLWNKQAENAAKYLAKGSQVYIEGRLTQEEWTDREGNNRITLKVNGTDMQFVGGNKQETREYVADESEADDAEEDSVDEVVETPKDKAKPAAAATKSAPKGKAKAAKAAAAADDDLGF